MGMHTLAPVIAVTLNVRVGLRRHQPIYDAVGALLRGVKEQLTLVASEQGPGECVTYV